MSSMIPIGIPPSAVRNNPTARAVHVGPPPGISDDDCGTPEVLVGDSEEGYPFFADYWRPTSGQLQTLIDGGYLELRQYVPRMIMHSLTVLPAEDDDL